MSLLNFQVIPISESQDPLVDLKNYDFILEPMYFKQGLSEDSRMFLRKTVADKLLKIQQGFKGYKFKLWDGYRSRKVQNAIYEKFWNELKGKNPDWDEEKLKAEVGVFVTDANDANRIPPHATGGSVDLTLVDKDGNELDMGTEFDYFGPEASSYYFENADTNIEARNNQKMLREAMIAEGFSVDKDEWWHFDFGNQKWALELNRSEAIFGEAKEPTIN
ncbi:MAG: M15 family metallopeptidase [Parcubacteria group bacterium]|jgi:D-alanyl-D-alanine dipeptidase